MQKILIIKHGSLGDIISSTAAIKSINNYYNNSSITILTANNYMYFFKKSNFCESLIQDNRKGFLNSIIIIFKLLVTKFDIIIDLQNSNRSSFYCMFLRIFSKAKINGTHVFSHYRYKYDKKNPPHVIDGLGKQINLLGIKTIQKPFISWLLNENFSISEIKNKKYFIINPGCSAKNFIKRWSSKNFAEVCTFLLNKNILPVVIGAGEDKKTINEIQELESRILNLYGKSPIEVIYNLALNAEGALSNDTGPAHLIAATNCKLHLVLSSFSNTKSVIPQSNNVTFTQSKLINEITSESIIKKIKLFLKNEN